MKAATIYDVARRAGVSHQTVSRFLAGFEGIRPETKARVESALAELEYRPNTTARMLRTNRSNRIGVLADRVDQTGPARIIAGATVAAREHGYLLDVVMTNGVEIDAIESALALVNEHRVAGIMATAQTDLMAEYLRQHAPSGPLVIDARMQAWPGGPSMNEYAGAVSADHLLDFGHRRVGYVSGPTAWLAASGRTTGFCRRVRERGGEVVWIRQGDWSAESGDAAWRGLSAEERTVTAIGTGNDSTAIGLISAAFADGVRVPHDLSVIGNDDIHESRYLLPALTTVAADFEGEGRSMIEQLLGEVDPALPAPRPPRVPHLVERGSTRHLT